jgi:penicillin amidase
LSPSEAALAWSRAVNVEGLPAQLDGGAGYLVSANERPQSEVPIGYFFSPPDRVERMAELLSGDGQIDLERIFRLQCDVFVRSSMVLRELILGKVQQYNCAASLGHSARAALEAISGWDGNYTEHSKGALAFEACRAVLVTRLCEPQLDGGDLAAYASVAAIEDMIVESIVRADAEKLVSAIAAAMQAAGEALRSFGDWGGVHRLQISHPFGLLPVIGPPFRYADLPVGGSSESLMKTAHGPVRGRHNVLFGSNARHVFDLSDPDGNYFVLLGGQDGWIGSTTFLDQLPLWRSGSYVKVPLRLEAVGRNAAARVALTP